MAVRPFWIKTVMLSAVAAVALWALPDAGADHGDIHAACQENDIALVLQRPPGTENVRVVCKNGQPEFFMSTPAVPAYKPELRPLPQAMPEDFGGWVTVMLNGRPLHMPYDPLRGVQEPGPYLAASTRRVLMPVRFFTEALGGKVEWWGEHRRARLTLPERPWPVILWLDEDQALLGAHQVAVDQRPVLYQDRMFVPVRFLVEAFDGQVTWDEAARTVRIDLDGLACDNQTYCGEMR